MLLGGTITTGNGEGVSFGLLGTNTHSHRPPPKLKETRVWYEMTRILTTAPLLPPADAEKLVHTKENQAKAN
jgi:hypothetical protein